MINSDLVHNCTADSAESACYVESVKNECELDLIDFTHIFSLMGKDVACCLWRAQDVLYLMITNVETIETN